MVKRYNFYDCLSKELQEYVDRKLPRFEDIFPANVEVKDGKS